MWWSFPLGFIVGTVLTLVYYRFGNWKKAHMLAKPQGGPV
jgi:Na+-driven multidrug efflux pump